MRTCVQTRYDRDLAGHLTQAPIDSGDDGARAGPAQDRCPRRHRLPRNPDPRPDGARPAPGGGGAPRAIPRSSGRRGGRLPQAAHSLRRRPGRRTRVPDAPHRCRRRPAPARQGQHRRRRSSQPGRRGRGCADGRPAARVVRGARRRLGAGVPPGRTPERRLEPGRIGPPRGGLRGRRGRPARGRARAGQAGRWIRRCRRAGRELGSAGDLVAAGRRCPGPAPRGAAFRARSPARRVYRCTSEPSRAASLARRVELRMRGRRGVSSVR